MSLVYKIKISAIHKTKEAQRKSLVTHGEFTAYISTPMIEESLYQRNIF